MYYKSTHISTWPPSVPRSTPENVRFEWENCFYEPYFLYLENDNIRKKKKKKKK